MSIRGRVASGITLCVLFYLSCTPEREARKPPPNHQESPAASGKDSASGLFGRYYCGDCFMTNQRLLIRNDGTFEYKHFSDVISLGPDTASGTWSRTGNTLQFTFRNSYERGGFPTLGPRYPGAISTGNATALLTALRGQIIIVPEGYADMVAARGPGPWTCFYREDVPEILGHNRAWARVLLGGLMRRSQQAPSDACATKCASLSPLFPS
jgi:hypothetical protein